MIDIRFIGFHTEGRNLFHISLYWEQYNSFVMKIVGR